METDLCAVTVSVNGIRYERQIEARLLVSDFIFLVMIELTLAAVCR